MDKAKYLPSGIYDGELAENFIETIKSEKRPFIKVKIKDFFDGYDEYPLVFVPVNFIIYPLQEGDKVKIFYPHTVSDVQFPVLYAVDFDMPDKILSNIAMPDSANLVSFPTAADTISFNYWGEKYYQIYTDKYALHKFGDTYVVLAEDKIFQYTSDSINQLAKIVNIEATEVITLQTGDNTGNQIVIDKVNQKIEFQVGGSSGFVFKLDKTGNTLTMKTGSTEVTINAITGKIKMTNGAVSVKTILESICDVTANMTTIGSPVLHTVLASDKALLNTIKNVMIGSLLE
jgi:hypothetical protein